MPSTDGEMSLYKVMFLAGSFDRDGILRKQLLEYYSETALLFLKKKISIHIKFSGDANIAVLGSTEKH